MALPKDNRVIIGAGAAVVVAAAVALALVFTGGEQSDEAPPASKGGLVVDLAEAPSLEPTRELRCFVDGQFVGMATLADCAQRNGLATDALDVGLDETVALAAAPTAAFAPPPELPPVEMAEAAPAPSPDVAAPRPQFRDAALHATHHRRHAHWRRLHGAGGGRHLHGGRPARAPGPAGAGRCGHRA